LAGFLNTIINNTLKFAIADNTPRERSH